MGKVTGFLEYDRQEQKYQLAGERVRHFREFTLPLDDNDLKKQAGRCMDCGIPFCHGPTAARCTTRSRTGTISSVRRLGGGRAQPPFHQQLPGIHRPHLPGSVRGGVHAQSREPAGHHQDHRAGHRRQGVGDGLDQARARTKFRPASASRSSARARPASRPPSSSPAPAMRCMCSSAKPSPAGCCATAFPTSRWRSTTSIGA